MMPCCPVGEASGGCQCTDSRHCWLSWSPKFANHGPRLDCIHVVCLRMYGLLYVKKIIITSFSANLGLIRCLVTTDGPPQEGQLMCKHSLSMRQEASIISDVILPHEENHGITVRRLKVLIVSRSDQIRSRKCCNAGHSRSA